MKALKYIILIVLTSLTQSCVQKTHTKIITFELDMRQVQNVSNVGVRGNTPLLNWENNFKLTDPNNDNIYEGRIEFKSASFDIEFKFVNNNETFELQDQNNRTIKFEYKPETIVYKAIFNNPDGQVTKRE